MNESKLCTIAQIEQFLNASALVEFSKSTGGDDADRYAHISRVLKRFDYHQRNKRERGLLLRYLRPTSGYSRPQMTRLVGAPPVAHQPPGWRALAQALYGTCRSLYSQIHVHRHRTPRRDG